MAIELTPEVESLVKAAAISHGFIDVADYIAAMAKSDLESSNRSNVRQDDQQALKLLEKFFERGVATGHSVDDSRESIYSDS